MGFIQRPLETGPAKFLGLLTAPKCVQHFNLHLLPLEGYPATPVLIDSVDRLPRFIGPSGHQEAFGYLGCDSRNGSSLFAFLRDVSIDIALSISDFL